MSLKNLNPAHPYMKVSRFVTQPNPIVANLGPAVDPGLEDHYNLQT